MKKRIICLFLALLMIIPFILTACEEELTEQEIMDQISNSGDIALTLSVWVPTNSDVNDQAFKDNLEAVQEYINTILRKDYTTQIEIKALPVAEYQQKLKEHVDSIRATTAVTDEEKKDPSKTQLPSVIADSYKNNVEKTESGRYEIDYPEVLSNQIDIFYISGEDNYRYFIDNQALYSLKSVLHEQTGSYNDIRKMIQKSILNKYQYKNVKLEGSSAAIADDDIFAIPNNHIYTNSENNKYILINKELYNQFYGDSGVDINSIKNITECEEFVNLVGEAGLEGVIPFVGGIGSEYASGFYDFPELVEGIDFDLIAGSQSDSTPTPIFGIKEYTDYITFYKKLSEKAYVSDALNENEKAAVMVLVNEDDVIKYADEYVIINSESPFIDEQMVYESMFAVSTFSANYSRALRILYLLQTDSEIITALQYGIEGTTYTTYENEDGEETIELIRNESTNEPLYDMTDLYIGNGYRTYMSENKSVEDWENVKYYINYSTVDNPYLNLLENFQNNAKDNQKNAIKASTEKFQELAEAVSQMIETMSAEEFEHFVELYNTDISALNKKITEYEKKEELTEEERADYEALLATKEEYSSNEVIKQLNSSDFKTLLTQYEFMVKSFSDTPYEE